MNEGYLTFITATILKWNHIHLIWRILEGHVYENVQRDFLKFTAQQIKFYLLSYHSNELHDHFVNKKDRQFQFWQRNPLSVELLTRDVVEEKLSYMHYNPVQDGKTLAGAPENYIYSTARFYELNIDDWGFITHYMEDC